jgi:hypothetical protein
MGTPLRSTRTGRARCPDVHVSLVRRNSAGDMSPTSWYRSSASRWRSPDTVFTIFWAAWFRCAVPCLRGRPRGRAVGLRAPPGCATQTEVPNSSSDGVVPVASAFRLPARGCSERVLVRGLAGGEREDPRGARPPVPHEERGRFQRRGARCAHLGGRGPGVRPHPPRELRHGIERL